MIKFRKDSDECMCGLPIPDEKYGALACMRTAAHAPPCIATACDAAAADGVCHSCRVPVGDPHRIDCFARLPS